jgi:clan AA aspartic protease (TIGR02281 family)
MKISINILIFSLFLFCVILEARADTVYLKNGHQISGIIKTENDEYVELEVNLGRVKFYRSQIGRVEHSSQDEKDMIEQSIKERRAINESEIRGGRQTREGESRDVKVGQTENHLFVDALLNKKVNVKLLVDTGASFIVLSPEIAAQLNINVASVVPDVKMSLADGREVFGKMIKIDTVSIGDAKTNGVEAVIIYQKGAFQGFDGLLGMSFLKLFKFEIDLNRNKLTLKKL